MDIEIKIIKQLTDNYCYIIYSTQTKEALILDPAEPSPIFDYLNSKNLLLKGILVTHHHSDHTQGVLEIKNKLNVNVYSPNSKIEGTTNLLEDKQTVDFEFIKFEIISTPGHTLDHIVFFCNKEKLLFSGDTLFYYGCGRVFEGTYEIMLKSLNKLKLLPDDTRVYCGHEYSYKNLEFVLDKLVNWQEREAIKNDLNRIIEKRGSSMPFDLGHQKDKNPFLNCNNPHYIQDIAKFHENEGKIKEDADELEFFTFIRDKRNEF